MSYAGIGTCLSLPDMGWVFDLAQGLSFSFGAKAFFISHAHQDHMGGIAYIISQRALNKLPPAIFYLPRAIIGRVHELLQIWSELEGHEYVYSLKAMEDEAGGVVAKDAQWKVSAFNTVHRVVSQGYQVWIGTKELKPEFVGRAGDELASLRRRGVDLETRDWRREFAYTGDTQIEVFEKSPEILDSRILFVECTYYDDRKSVASAREWGHIHLSELKPWVEAFKGERMVLIHPSRKYRSHEVWPLVEKELGASLLHKIDLFCGAPGYGNPMYLR